MYMLEALHSEEHNHCTLKNTTTTRIIDPTQIIAQ